MSIERFHTFPLFVLFTQPPVPLDASNTSCHPFGQDMIIFLLLSRSCSISEDYDQNQDRKHQQRFPPFTAPAMMNL
jgi:hypothetical protein